MRSLLFLLEKEFRQIFRNRTLLRMIVAVPVIQLLILPLAANFEVRNVNISIVDHDRSAWSRELVGKITGSRYFHLASMPLSYIAAMEDLRSDRADVILVIPGDFGKRLIREDQQAVHITVNAINGTRANLGGAYLQSILRDFNENIRFELITEERFRPMPVLTTVTSNWYNPYLNYKFFMVPGILAILVTMVGGYMSALNIVREKEVGTIEQVNVSPIRKHYFLLGKLIPFWILGMFVFSVGLFVIAIGVYGIIPAGSILSLYAILSVYLLAVLGFGLLISTYSETQQQAMSLAFFFIMIFFMMSGLFTPIDSMPEWAKAISRLNPVTYFIEVMRMIVLRGSTFGDVTSQFFAILAFAVVLNGWAVLNYRKTS